MASLCRKIEMKFSNKVLLKPIALAQIEAASFLLLKGNPFDRLKVTGNKKIERIAGNSF
jgi:hypothetical protein